MKFLQRTRRSEEELSVSSSVRSIDSYGVFGSTYTDESDCEICGDRLRAIVGQNYSSISASTSSFNTAMGTAACEKTCLLGAAAKDYKLNDYSDSLGPADFSTKAILSTYQKLEEQKKPERKKQSSLVTIFSIWNTTMGSSLLTMAWGVGRAGLAPALVLLGAMGALCLYTAHLLLTVARHHGGECCEVPTLCRALLGRWAERLAHCFSVLVLLGANIVYWILISNFLFFTVNYFVDVSWSNSSDYNSTLWCRAPLMPDEPWTPGTAEAGQEGSWWQLHGTVPLVVAVLVFPLLNFKNASFFTKFNSLGTLSVGYLLVFVATKATAWGVHWPREPEPAGAPLGAAALSGMLALSFYIHNIIISIMSTNEKQQNNGRDLTIAFVLVILTYSLVGAVFYISFPLAKSCIEDNILNNFEMHDVMTAVARILLLFQVLTVYPLVAFMLRSETLLLLPLREDLKTGRGLTILVNVLIISVCILFACFCPSIGTIIRYTGAVSGLVHVFALPSLLQLRSLWLRGRLNWPRALWFGAIMVFGTANLLLQFFISE